MFDQMKAIIEAIKNYSTEPVTVQELTIIANAYKEAGYSCEFIKKEFSEMYGVEFKKVNTK